MPPDRPACPVCGETDPTRVREVVVEGRTIVMCKTHAGIVIRAKPATLDALRELFREEQPDGTPARRSVINRRDTEQSDRRAFPRPEGRRMGYGRRANDPTD